MKGLRQIGRVLLVGSVCASLGVAAVPVQQVDAAPKSTVAPKITLAPQEPAADEKCAMCKMTVYPKDHNMGAFSSQLVTADGKRVFFDDMGCMLNFKRLQSKPTKAGWVRDHDTKEWVGYSKAVLVDADIETPMGFGVATFASKARAQAFIQKNPQLHGKLMTWEEATAIAKKKYEMKKKMNM